MVLPADGHGMDGRPLSCFSLTDLAPSRTACASLSARRCEQHRVGRSPCWLSNNSQACRRATNKSSACTTAAAATPSNSPAATSLPLPRVYLYDDPALDHSWLACAPGFDQLMRSAHGRFLAEVGMHRALARSPRRTLLLPASPPSSGSADTSHHEPVVLFHVPVYEYTSWKLGAIRSLRSGNRAFGAG